jgi:pyruvate carboxylase
MFGDIIKVTPTSKVVGDMALMMVTSGIDRNDVLDPDREIAFPESVVSMFRGDLGQPYGGFPKELQRKILNGAAPLNGRPGAFLPPVDLAAERSVAEGKAERTLTDQQFASYLMYPKVFLDWIHLPTPVWRRQHSANAGIFYGMSPGEEISVDTGRDGR